MSKVQKEMVVSSDRHETRVTILEDKQLMEIYVEPLGNKSIVGNIYLGVVRDILPGIEAAFVDIGLEKNAFLYSKEVSNIEDVATPAKIEHLLKRGQDILVQVVKEPIANKGARVTTQIAVPGRFLVLMPTSKETLGLSRKLVDKEKDRLRKISEEVKPPNLGLIVRTAAEGRTKDDLKKDIKQLQKLWWYLSRKLKKAKPVKLIYEEPDLEIKAIRDWFDEDFKSLVIDSKDKYNKIISFLKRFSHELIPKVELYRNRLPLFDHFQINDQIKKALRRKVWLKSGGSISIDHTEALTAIDVNTAKFIGKTSLRQTVLKTNLEAAKEVIRQIRLRDIGGIIVIDFIDMEEPKDRDQVFKLFNKELMADRTKSRVIDISKIGLVEMTRKSTSESLLKALSETCPCCKGSGLMLKDETLAISAEREIMKTAKTKPTKAFLFRMNPQIIKEFKDAIIEDVRAETGKRIYIIADGSVNPDKPELLFEGSKDAVEDELEREGQEKEHV